MTPTVTKPLPHMVGVADIANPELKRVTMLFMENFKSIARQLSEVQGVATAMKRALAANSIEIDAVDKDARRRLAKKADLDDSGKVPASQLPSYVDDVLEYASLADFPAEGEEGKIYVAIDTDKVYRWSGTRYVEVSPAPQLATVAETGDYNDLNNKPTIPPAPVNADWDATEGLAKILNKPSIPDASKLVTREYLEMSSTPYVEFPDFTKPATYAVGDCVTYNGSRYVCKTAHTVSSNGSFVNNYWQIVTNFSSSTYYQQGAIAIYSGKYYRRKSAGSGSWNASLWEEVLVDKLYGIIDKRFVNSICVSNNPEFAAVTNTISIRMQDLVIDAARTYSVDFCYRRTSSNFSWAIGNAIEINGAGAAISRATNQVTANTDYTETRADVSGSATVTIMLNTWMTCVMKVYIPTT
jgi:hypothetical protein